MSDVLDGDAIGFVIKEALEYDLSFQLNVHGVNDLSEAISLAGKCLGGSDRVGINQQASCYVVTAQAGKGTVAFFVSKNAEGSHVRQDA